MTADYRAFIQAAYDYYHGNGSDMSDAIWDQLAKRYADAVAKYHDTDYDGGSMFWLKKEQYPTWVIKDNK